MSINRDPEELDALNEIDDIVDDVIEEPTQIAGLGDRFGRKGAKILSDALSSAEKEPVDKVQEKINTPEERDFLDAAGVINEEDAAPPPDQELFNQIEQTADQPTQEYGEQPGFPQGRRPDFNETADGRPILDPGTRDRNEWRNFNFRQLDAPQAVLGFIDNVAKTESEKMTEATRGVRSWGKTEQSARAYRASAMVGARDNAVAAGLGVHVEGKNIVKALPGMEEEFNNFIKENTYQNAVQRLTGGYKPGTAFNAEKLWAAVQLLEESASRVHNLAKHIEGMRQEGGEESVSPDMLVAFAQMYNQHVGIQQVVAGATSEAGRSLNILKAVKRPGGYSQMRDQQVKHTLGLAGGTERIWTYIRGMAATDDPAMIGDMARAAQEVYPSDLFLEVYINGLLSAAPTHLVNLTGSQIAIIEQPVERQLAGLIGAVRRTFGGKDGVEVREGMMMMIGMFRAITRDAPRVAWGAYRQGVPLDPAKKLDLENYRSVTTENVSRMLTRQYQTHIKGNEAWEEDYQQNEAGWVGKVFDMLAEHGLRQPQKLLFTADQFNKAIAYVMELEAMSFRKAVQADSAEYNSIAAKQGWAEAEGSLTDQQALQLYHHYINNPSEEIHLGSTKLGELVTLTTPLGDTGESFAKMINAKWFRSKENPDKLIRDHLYVPKKMLVTFYNVIVNIPKYTLGKFPISARWRMEWLEGANDPAKRDIAMARLVMGSAYAYGAMQLAAGEYEGIRITGQYPRGRAERQLWQRSHIKPYSIGWQGADGKWSWVAYDRLDPLVGTVLGLAANSYSVMRESEDFDDLTNVAGALTLAVADFTVSKSYTSNIHGMFRALDYGDDAWQRWIDRNVASMAQPVYSSQVRRVAKQYDDTRRVAEGVLEAICARTPGCSKDLPAAVDFYGRTKKYSASEASMWNPLDYGVTSLTVPDQAMYNDGYFLSEPTRRISGYKVSAKRRNELLRIRGQDIRMDYGYCENPNGCTLQEEMTNFVRSEDYQELTPGEDGSRKVEMERLVRAYTDEAVLWLRLRDPELNEEIAKSKAASESELYGEETDHRDYMVDPDDYPEAFGGSGVVNDNPLTDNQISF